MGKEHPDTLTSMADLVGVPIRQGKYEQAEEMNRRALGLSETVLGKDHPHKYRQLGVNISIGIKDNEWDESENLGR